MLSTIRFGQRNIDLNQARAGNKPDGPRKRLSVEASQESAQRIYCTRLVEIDTDVRYVEEQNR